MAFRKSEFKKNVLVLITGTAIAQAIPIAISPILTRIYSPKDFGLLGLYMAFCSLLSVFSSGRYDMAIIEPASDDEAKHLVDGSILLSLCVSGLLFVIIVLFNEKITVLSGNRDIKAWLYTIPVTVFALSSLSIFSYWLNRKKRFRDMSINRIVNSSSNVSISLSLGLLSLKKSGLIIGFGLGQIITVSLLWKKIFTEKIRFNRKMIAAIMKKYIRYPKYLIPATFAGEASSQVPIIQLTTFFDASISGFFTLTNKVTVLPMSLIGNAIGEVYRQKASEEYSKFGNCKDLYLKTLGALFLIGLLPLLVLFFFSVPLFTFVFGHEWTIAGEMAKYTSFIVFFQLLSTPLSYTIVFNKSQKYDLLLQIGRAVMAISSIAVGFYLSSFRISIILYSISYSIYYVSHSILQYRAACGYPNIK
jgi:O-antigen/teichoic acid export membrane protein